MTGGGGAWPPWARRALGPTEALWSSSTGCPVPGGRRTKLAWKRTSLCVSGPVTGDACAARGYTRGMGVQRVVAASMQDVWAVLADGWLYPLWVVGAVKMRAVDESWPAPGARLHHSSGLWPLLVDDTTSVEACEPRRRLELTARGWPAGEARVTITLQNAGPGATVVRLEEDPHGGVGRLVPGVLRRRGSDARNAQTLHRLDLLVVGRAAR